MTDRRAFIGTLAGGLLAAPLAVEAKQTGRVYRIGVCHPRRPISAGSKRSIKGCGPSATSRGLSACRPVTKGFAGEVRVSSRIPPFS